MNARIWTVTELDVVHPLRDGWRWSIGVRIGSALTMPSRPWAYRLDDLRAVEVDDGGCVLAFDTKNIRFDPPDDVALAVILANMGLDSMESMVAKLDEWAAKAADEHEAQLACVPMSVERAVYCDGQAHAWKQAAALLRGGRVNP